MSNDSRENPPKAGVPIELEDGIRMVLAPNPSAMTYWGTNTYLLGHKDITVIDPGPENSEHLDAILTALGPYQSISQIVVTHSHRDHSPLAAALKEQTGARVIAFGDSLSGRSEAMVALAKTGHIGGSEGVDEDFAPDRLVADGDVIMVEDNELKVIHTPGHMGNHICLGFGDVCFTGDHVMGWASSMVSPPDGDLTDFMVSCDKLAKIQWRVFYPAHGAPIHEPNTRVEWLTAHRRSREAGILEQLKKGPADAASLTRAIYHDVNPKLLPAAERNVLAHLVDLNGRGLVRPQQTFEIKATFVLV